MTRLLVTIIWLSLLSSSLAAQYTSDRDTTVSKKYVAIGATLLTTGIIMDQGNLKRDFQSWVRDRVETPTYTIDDYIQHVPIVAVIVSDYALGRTKADKKRHVRHLLVTEATALVVVNSERPNGASFSMPSGHTAYSFASAGVLYHSLKEDHPFWAYSGYAMATFVGASRVLRDKHWISDVLVGAGIGILSSHLTYHLDIWNSRGSSPSTNSSASHISIGMSPAGVGVAVQF